MTQKPRRSPHPFVADRTLPPDQSGREVCARCHLLGKSGDAHHAMPAAGPEQDEHRRRAGESEGAE